MRNLLIISVFLLFLLFDACSSESQVSTMPHGNGDSEDEINYSELFKEMRRDETRGQGGEFAISINRNDQEVETYVTAWGYVDHREFHNTGTSKLTFFANPPEANMWPFLRLSISLTSQSIEKHIGESLYIDSMLFKAQREKNKPATRGFGHLIITTLVDENMTGEFTGDLEDGSTIKGTFKVKLNRVADQIR